MAEYLTIANIKKIVDLAIAVKRAVDTVRHNERACRRVEGTVSRVCGLIRLLGTSPSHVAMLQHPCVAGVLDDVVDSLKEALTLVAKCQEKSSFLQLATASRTARKLKSVQDELLQKVSLCTLMVTTMSAVAMTDNRPQFSRQFDIPSSRSELALQLRDTYTDGGEILHARHLFAIGPTKSTDNSPSLLPSLLAPFGVGAIELGMVIHLGGVFNPYTLAECFTKFSRRTRPSVKIQEIDDDNSDATLALAALLPAPAATESSHLLLAPAAPLPLLQLPVSVATDDSSHLLQEQDQEPQQQQGKHGEENVFPAQQEQDQEPQQQQGEHGEENVFAAQQEQDQEPQQQQSEHGEETHK